jgi:hypothetical protein
MYRRSVVLVALTAACGGRAVAPSTAPANTSPAPAPVAAAAEPSTLRYAAGTGRYKVETALNMAQDMMGNVTEVTATTIMIMSTTLTDDGGNLLLTATLDSVSVTGNMPGVDASALSGARGKTFRARFTPSGRPLPAPPNPDSSDALVTQLGRGIREFLAVLPAAAVTAGASWTDTTTESNPMPGGTGAMNTRSIREHRVVGWETRDGARALHMTTSGTFTISGSGEVQGGTPVEMTGNGSATLNRWVSTTGTFIGSTGRDSTNLTVNVPTVGMSIPIRQTQVTTVTKLQ